MALRGCESVGEHDDRDLEDESLADSDFLLPFIYLPQQNQTWKVCQLSGTLHEGTMARYIGAHLQISALQRLK